MFKCLICLLILAQRYSLNSHLELSILLLGFLLGFSTLILSVNSSGWRLPQSFPLILYHFVSDQNL
jgi:hypothetical protein